MTPGQDMLLYVAEPRDQLDKLLVHISPQQLQPQPAPNLVDQWKILSLQMGADYPTAAPVLIFHYSSLDAGNFHKARAPLNFGLRSYGSCLRLGIRFYA